jgi:FixJ family two-component response regulator
MSGSPSRPLVVVIDDDAGMLNALGRLLRASGFDTALHDSAEDFLGHSPPAAPVCFVIDVCLRGMSGFDLRERMIAERSRVPVIFITANDEPAVRLEAARLECLAYLCKPFEGQRLVALIPRPERSHSML